ncbi:MAG TPA: hypothetical protein VIC85_02910 [Ktedonobacterales bacterium]
MKLRWPVLGGRPAHRSRPLVARAIEEARAAHATPAAQATETTHALASARALTTGTQVIWAEGLFGNETPFGVFASRHGAAERQLAGGVSPALVWATSRAARESGRAPEDVWSEALRNWLTIQDLAAAEAATDPSLGRLDARRAQAWQAIDATLFALRAS